MNSYERVTEELLAAMRRGVCPWRRSWRSVAPCNAITGRLYRGINVPLLTLAGRNDPRWLSFYQAREAGGNVRKGEHGRLIVFWKMLADVDDETGEQQKHPLLRSWTVFNVEQCDNLSLPAWQPTASDPIADAETVANGYAGGPTVRSNPEHAYYDPAHDLVSLPPRGAFARPEAYYSTLFHELAHSTGHPKRLARKEVCGGIVFGSCDYSLEELTAEFGAQFLCDHAGIASEREQAAAYLAHWITKLEDEPRMAVIAATRAQKVADWILGRYGDEEATPTEALAGGSER